MSKMLLQRFACNRATTIAFTRSPLVLALNCEQQIIIQHQHQQHQHQHQQPHQQHHQQQRRNFWMDVVRIKTKHGKNGGTSSEKHEDPEQVIRRHTEQTRSDGESLIDLMFFNDKHEKAWMKRKRLQGIKRYEFDKRHVTDLAKYIAFVKDQKDGQK